MTKKTRGKMKKGAWSPEAREKAAATRAANRAKKAGAHPNEGRVKDAVAYLMKAEGHLVTRKLKHIGPVETLMLLALNTLRGEL